MPLGLRVSLTRQPPPGSSLRPNCGGGTAPGKVAVVARQGAAQPRTLASPGVQEDILAVSDSAQGSAVNDCAQAIGEACGPDLHLSGGAAGNRTRCIKRLELRKCRSRRREARESTWGDQRVRRKVLIASTRRDRVTRHRKSHPWSPSKR